MANFKFVKSATAAVLGASVLTTAVVVPGADASAKTTYKVNKNGTLVNAKTNKAVKGYKTYKGKLYKNGKKFTGKTSSGVYYVKGKKFTGKTKYGYYYVNGKRFTGTTKYGYYYVNGKRFNGKTKYGNLYVDGKRYTGTTKYGYTYYNGKRVEGEYKAKVYTNGKLVTGLYKEKLYNKGVLETGLDLYKEKLYKDGVLNVGYALYNNELYKDTVKNVGFIADPLKDGKAYYDALLANGTYDVEGVEKAYEDGVEVGAKVKSVEAINAKELKITFNKTVKEDTVVAAATSGAEVKDTLVDDAITISSLDGKAVTANSTTASLSEDGKTLTLKATGAEVFSGRYDVKIAAGAIKTTAKEDVAKFETTINTEDKIAPTVVSTEKVTATQYKVNFSEPVKSLGTDTYKLADGTVLATADAAATTGVRVDFTPGNDYATFTLGSDVAANKVVTATFVGLQDYALNLVDPNPTTVSFTKGAADGVAPTVTSLTAVNNKTVEVKFSEELSANPVITGMAGTLTVTQDKTDKTKYTIKSDTAQSGLQSISVAAGYTDLSGETGAIYTKLLNFDVDTVAPKFVSSKVEVGSDNAEYLVLTFDENITSAAGLANIAVTGTATKDYVTSSFTATVAASKLVVDTDNAKIARIKLDDLVGSSSNAGTAYDLTLTGKTAAPADNAIVDDISGNKGASAIKAAFTRGTDGAAASKNQATIDTSLDTNGIKVENNNELTVAFNQELDGASATNVSNYSIDGATVEKAILNPASGTPAKQTVTLKLKANSNVFTGERNVTISGVKAKNGLAMDTYKTTETLKENVAPTVTKAVLTGTTTITLTFSEKVTNATAAVGDFDLYIGGVKSANTVETAAQTTAANTITLTLGTALDAATIAKGLTLQAADSPDLQDEAGNIVSVPTAITVAQ